MAMRLASMDSAFISLELESGMKHVRGSGGPKPGDTASGLEAIPSAIREYIIRKESQSDAGARRATCAHVKI
jgi:hypothetical protein